jgi:hypothetical protein
MQYFSSKGKHEKQSAKETQQGKTLLPLLWSNRAEGFVVVEEWAE